MTTLTRRQGVILVGVGLAAILASIVIDVGFRRSALPAGNRHAAPGVVFEPPVLQLGDMIAGELARVQAIIANAGPVPVEILQVASSCACTTAGPVRRLLMPGASAPLTVLFNSSFRRGEVQELVMVRWKDASGGKPQESDLELDARVQRLDWADPGEIDFGAVRLGSTSVRSLVLRSTRPITWRPRIEAPGPARVELLSSPRPSGRACPLRLAFHAAGAPGPVDATVRIVLGPSLPPLEVPLSCTVTGDFAATPADLDFGLVRRGQAVSRTLSVLPTPGESGRPIGLVSAPGWLRVSTSRRGNGLCVTAVADSHRLRRHATMAGSIRVETNDRTQPIVEVPVELMAE